jgi:hypothetical protein
MGYRNNSEGYENVRHQHITKLRGFVTRLSDTRTFPLIKYTYYHTYYHLLQFSCSPSPLASQITFSAMLGPTLRTATALRASTVGG